MKKIQCLVALAALAMFTTGAFAEETMPQPTKPMHHDAMQHHDMTQNPQEAQHKLSAETHKPNWENQKEETKEEKTEEMHEKTHPKTNVTQEKNVHKEMKTTNWETKKVPSNASKEMPKH